MIFTLIGSLGLFLLGMWLMTEGLKLAGGKALKNLLGTWTSNRTRALASGIGITALVQSSSAVTVATIGFVNAGLLSFQQALWVVFGSNIGTTFTAWIVTFFGFKLDIEVFTFPLIGVGAALRIFSPYERGRAFGMALAGFGLLFMGIDALQENFSAHAHEINIEALLAKSAYTTLIALGIGFMLTVLTQSSSAAIAIILTAVAGGISGIEVAAASVIGANIGTTSTALIATIGATANARRLALAHVAFNTITAIVALIILPFFLMAVSALVEARDTEVNLMLKLAMFHTGFNLLGLLVIWPIAPKLSRFLSGLFRESDAHKVHSLHIDPNVAAVPDLAIRAMTLELDSAIKAINGFQLPETEKNPFQMETLDDLESKLNGLEGFIALTFKSELTKEQASHLTAGLSTSYYLKNACKTFRESIAQFNISRAESPFAEQYLLQWYAHVNKSNRNIYSQGNVSSKETIQQLQAIYQDVKMELLKASINKKLAPELLDNALQAASYSRRFIEQLSQAYDAFAVFSQSEEGVPENLTQEIETTESFEQEASDNSSPPTMPSEDSASDAATLNIESLKTENETNTQEKH